MFAVKSSVVGGEQLQETVVTQRYRPRKTFEETLREMRLQNTLRTKREIMARLKQVDQSIDTLTALKNEAERSASPTRKPKEYTWLTEEERKRWKQDWLKKTQEADEFTKRVRAVQKDIQRRDMEKQRVVAIKEAEEEADKKKLEEETARLEAEQKGEEKKRKETETEEKRKEREMMLELARAKMAKRSYAYQVMQQRYEEEVEIPELEKRKQEIAEKRNLYRPIRKAEIEAHEKLCDELAKKQEEELRKARVIGNPEYVEKVKKQFRTVFTEEVIKKRQAEREYYQKLGHAEKERQQKRLEYAKTVKSEFVPEVSEEKAKEMQSLIKKLKQPVRQVPPRKARLTPGERDRILHRDRKSWTGNEHTESARRSVDPEKRHAARGSCRRVSMGVQVQTEIRAPVPLSRIPKNLKQSMPTIRPKIDYLAEVKKAIHRKRVEEELDTKGYCDKVLQDGELSPKQKFDKVKSQVDLIEGNARKKEMMLVKGGVSSNLQIGTELSDMYINAIKAKISLLDL